MFEQFVLYKIAEFVLIERGISFLSGVAEDSRELRDNPLLF